MKKVLALTALLVTGIVQAKEIQIPVSGMVCSMCAQGIEKKFTKLEEVKTINVDLGNKLVTITTKEDKDLQNTQIKEIITEAGYNVNVEDIKRK